MEAEIHGRQDMQQVIFIKTACFISAQIRTGKQRNAAHRAGKVYEGMHFHEVILDGRAGDDDWQPYWTFPQALRQLRARVLDLVPLHESNVKRKL